MSVSVPDLLKAAADGVHGLSDKYADYIRGSDYDVLAGPCAILGSRESQRDEDLFRSIHLYSASGEDLTNIALYREGVERVLDTVGIGYAVLRRTTTATAGTIYKGTRISIHGSASKSYEVTSDTGVLVGDTTVRVPIAALAVGPDSATDLTTNITVDDALFDATFAAVRLYCAPGTLLESAAALQNRIRQTKLDARVGHETAIVKACTAAGAVQVACFRNDYAGDAYDYGLNYVYVGDSGYSATDDLLKACTKALRRVRVLGDNLQVRPMARQDLKVSVVLTLANPPSTVNLNRLRMQNRAAVMKYFGGSGEGWSYNIEALAAAIVTSSPEIRNISFVTPTTSSVFLGAGNNLPGTLTRFVVSDIVTQYVAV